MSPLDASYMPCSIIIFAGQTVGGLSEIKQCSLPSTAREFPLITALTEVRFDVLYINGCCEYVQ